MTWLLRVLVALVIASTVLSACDRWEGVTVRNDTERSLTVRVSWQREGMREAEIQAVELAPGATRDVGKIGGPPDAWPDIIVRAYETAGALVYCHRFTAQDQKNVYGRSTVRLTVGDLRCG